VTGPFVFSSYFQDVSAELKREKSESPTFTQHPRITDADQVLHDLETLKRRRGTWMK
jgi:hypothetical protein